MYNIVLTSRHPKHRSLNPAYSHRREWHSATSLTSNE